jgi:hypothetical protein
MLADQLAVDGEQGSAQRVGEAGQFRGAGPLLLGWGHFPAGDPIVDQGPSRQVGRGVLDRHQGGQVQATLLHLGVVAFHAVLLEKRPDSVGGPDCHEAAPQH